MLLFMRLKCLLPQMFIRTVNNWETDTNVSDKENLCWLYRRKTSMFSDLANLQHRLRLACDLYPAPPS